MGNESVSVIDGASPKETPAHHSSLITRHSILNAALLLMIGNALSRLLGLGREQVIAALFGSTAVTSAFTTASAVPTMVYDLLVGGAISAALVPVFTEFQSDRAELRRVAGSVAVLVLVLLATATVLLVVAAPLVVHVLGAGATGSSGEAVDDEVFARTVEMVRWLLPALLFLGFSGLSSALLFARQQFISPAFAVASYNAAIIIIALALAPSLGPLALVLGVLVGAVVQCLVQWPALRDLAWGVPDFRHPGVRRVVGLYAPVAGGLIVSMVGIVLDRNLAWRIGEDSVAVMRFATTLVQLPLGLVGTALSIAILPTLARLAESSPAPSNEDSARQPSPSASAPQIGDASYKQTLGMGMRLSVVLMVPAMVGLVFLREPIVGLLFERGAFDSAATSKTATAFLYYAPQMPFVAIDQLLIVAFYARKNTLTPMLVGLFGVGVYLTVALSLMTAGFGLPALILANTAQHVLHAVVLFLLLRRAIGSLGGRALGLATMKAMGAALLGVIAAATLGGFVPTPTDLLSRLSYVLLVGGVFTVVYGGVLVALRTEELRPVLGRVWRIAQRA